MPSIASLLGIELPVIQAPMGGVQDEALAISVAEAGGLGSMPCALLDSGAKSKTFADCDAARVTRLLAGRP